MACLSLPAGNAKMAPCATPHLYGCVLELAEPSQHTHQPFRASPPTVVFPNPLYSRKTKRKDCKCDIRNGPSTTAPLVAHPPRPTTTFSVIRCELPNPLPASPPTHRLHVNDRPAPLCRNDIITKNLRRHLSPICGMVCIEAQYGRTAKMTYP